MSAISFESADPKALLALPNGAVTVTLQQSDLDQGQRFLACSDPIAYALARTFGLPRWNITVSCGDVFVHDNNGRVIRWWRMDETGRGFRVFWDAGARNLAPLSFLLIPQPVPYMQADDVYRLQDTETEPLAWIAEAAVTA